jgi:putative hydrolase of the HAD superfamily
MTRAKHTRAVTFDAAGTLMGVAEPVGESYARIAHSVGARLSAEDLDAAFREVFPHMPPMAFAPMDEASRLRCERGWWRTLVQRVLAHAGEVGAFDEYFDTLFAYYASGSAWRAYPDAHSALRAARARGLAVAVVSNFDSRLVPILQALGFADLVDAVVYSTACGSAKPDAGIFQHALERLGVAAQHALHVGDNLDADYRGAMGAGMTAVHLDRHASATPADITTIGHLGQLESLYD